MEIVADPVPMAVDKNGMVRIAGTRVNARHRHCVLSTRRYSRKNCGGFFDIDTG